MDVDLFNKTCKKVMNTAIDIDGVIGNSSKIGTLGEKTVHAVVKNYIEPNPSNQEIKIKNFYIDIVNDKGLIEIQTGSFNRLKNKLDTLLDLTPITIVYPICHIKMIYWIDDKTGEVTNPRKSTKTGNPYCIFRELYKIKDYLYHPNLKFQIILMDMNEYRLLDGWSKDKKSGATKCDRIPTKLVNELEINSLKDYDLFLPENLPSYFTVKDYKAASNIKQNDAQAAIHILNHLGRIKKIGNKGKSYLYTCQK